MKKFREHRSLAPIRAFSKRLDTRICPNDNDTSEDLTNITANICCCSNEKIWKFQKICECFFFTCFHFLAI